MEKVKAAKKFYILCAERAGEISKGGISKLIGKEESFFRADKGDIFIDLPTNKQPEDESRIRVVLYGNENKFLVVKLEDLAEISPEAAELLLPVTDREKRYELNFTRRFMEQAIAAGVGDIIEAFYDGAWRMGIVKKIGKNNEKLNGRFEVELQIEEKNPRGITMTKFVNFTATIDQLKFNQKSNNAVDGLKEIETYDEFENFKKGMKVGLINDKKTLKGIIRFIGKAKDEEEMTYGVELETADGNSTGIFKGHKVFSCKRNYAVFVKGDELIDDKVLQGNEPDNYAMIESDDSLKSNMLIRSQLDGTGDKSQTLGKNRKKVEAIPLQKISEQSKHQQKAIGKENKMMDDPSLGLNMIDGNERFKSASNQMKSSFEFGMEKNSHTQIKEKRTGPSSLPFNDNHFGNERPQKSITRSSRQKETKFPRHGSENSLDKLSAEVAYQQKQVKSYSYDPSLQVDSVVQVSIRGVPRYGLVKWIGHIPEMHPTEMIAGLEMEEPSQDLGDGSFKNKRYYICPAGRGFFVKLSACKKDERFISNAAPSTLPANQSVEEIKENILPPEKFDDVKIGRMQGIQGHHNSCYLDATLFAMFSFSSVFDSVLYREKRPTDIDEYEQVRNALKNAIVNPLRKKGFVNAASVLRLRGWLDKLASVPGFMNEEKDPEEFLMLLLKDVLKVDPFLRIRTNQNKLDMSYFHQILMDKEEYITLPTLQYLFESSFLSGSFRLEEVPSVLVIQLPRSGLQKMYKRIRLNPTLDVSAVMSDASFECLICLEEASYSCKDCCMLFGSQHPFIHYCSNCNDIVHSKRAHRQVKKLGASRRVNECNEIKKLELFAVVCIRTSHYVTFAKCGNAPNDEWVFFDSMSDRIGEEAGHNVPEIIECPEIREWFDKAPLAFTESDSKNTPEKVLRLFEDASLCFYRNCELSMYM